MKFAVILYFVAFANSLPLGLENGDPIANKISKDDVQIFKSEDPIRDTRNCKDIDGRRVEFDDRCLDNVDKLGCNAGNQGAACRYCGFGVYPACPGLLGEPEQNPLKELESLDYFEGDILLIGTTAEKYLSTYIANNEEIQDLIKNQADPSGEVFRNAIRNRKALWKDYTIPYTMSNRFDYDERTVILSAMATLEEYTCLRFVPRTYHEDYITIIRGGGCYSYIGRWGGRQPLSLGYGCVWKGTVMHEIMHALGFHHEQSRADRDNYIWVYLQNVFTGQEYNFQKYTLKEIDHLNEPYDYTSLMHYTSTAFSVDGIKKTIVPKQSGIELKHSSTKDRPSQIDINKINKLYGCPSTVLPPTTPAPTEPPTPGPDPNCKDINPYCKSWAASGLCSPLSEYMQHACASSCRSCSSTTNQCVDHNTNCADWRRNGECTRTPEFLRAICPKSCQYCSAECAAKEGYSPLVAHAELRFRETLNDDQGIIDVPVAPDSLRRDLVQPK